MATRADVEAVRLALTALSSRARQDFLRVWATLDPSDWASVRRALSRFWPELVGHYGAMSAVLAADQFVAQAHDIGLSGDPRVVRAVDPERASARLRWAIGVPDQLGSILLVLDELVKQPYRSTLQHSARDAGGAWARVPSGSDTCSFCVLLASRGAVYESREAAQFTQYGDKYHGDCDCVPVLARSDAELPYDVSALSDLYSDASEASESTRLKAVLSALREQTGRN